MAASSSFSFWVCMTTCKQEGSEWNRQAFLDLVPANANGRRKSSIKPRRLCPTNLILGVLLAPLELHLQISKLEQELVLVLLQHHADLREGGHRRRRRLQGGAVDNAAHAADKHDAVVAAGQQLLPVQAHLRARYRSLEGEQTRRVNTRAFGREGNGMQGIVALYGPCEPCTLWRTALRQTSLGPAMSWGKSM